MIKRETQDKQVVPSRRSAFCGYSSSHAIQHFDEERVAQQEEFLKRAKAETKQPFSKQFRSKKPRRPTKPKVLSFDQKLELTNQWLEETFPHLFAADDYVPLDEHILRDLKGDYRNNHLKKKYPQDLVMKAALARYKESPGYLACLKEGVPKYTLKGTIAGRVTREEEHKAKAILEKL